MGGNCKVVSPRVTLCLMFVWKMSSVSFAAGLGSLGSFVLLAICCNGYRSMAISFDLANCGERRW